MNKYNNIKRILRGQIERGVKALWTFNEEKKEFNFLYREYDDTLKIYTPQQLIYRLEEKSEEKD